MEEVNLDDSLKSQKTDVSSNNLEIKKVKEKESILLVEDHKMTQMLVKRFLLNHNYKVDVVSDGETALTMVKSNHYNLILMDLNLPGIDGFETTKQIRNTPNTNADVPVLALTSSAQYEVREKMFEAGMNDYIGKPFNPKELTYKVNLFLQ